MKKILKNTKKLLQKGKRYVIMSYTKLRVGPKRPTLNS